MDCYLLLLDASKTFDRVEYVKSLKMLKDRDLEICSFCAVVFCTCDCLHV